MVFSSSRSRLRLTSSPTIRFTATLLSPQALSLLLLLSLPLLLLPSVAVPLLSCTPSLVAVPPLNGEHR